MTMHETVFNQLPASGEAIGVFDLAKKINGLSKREVRASLLELQKEGRAGLDYGFGWFRVGNTVAAATEAAPPGTEVEAEFTSFHGESQASAKAASEAIDEYYTSTTQSLAVNDAISEDDGYAALRWITAKAIENAEFPAPATVASLDGTVDEAGWIAEGHVLDVQEVAYIRSLIIPATTLVTASEG